MGLRQEQDLADWPLRPWLFAVICSAAGFLFHSLIDAPTLPAWRQALASFVAIATVSFVITAELKRLHWALVFALAWGTVIALVGWFTASYNPDGEIAEWPFLSGIFAVLLAAPLFQTVRDEGRWRFPYPRLHRQAWTDAVIGAASLGFTGITFLLAFLIAGLFNLIGIELLQDLLEEAWFAWILAGFAFGGAVGMLRERDALLATLERLAMVVLSVLAPVLAAALVLFLASLPFTGLGGLWGSDVPTTPLLLLAGAGAILLANAVIGNGAEERSPNPFLRWSALALVAAVLPLAVLAAVSMGLRIGQYGWTPERIWGVIAVGVAIAYGLAGWWSVWRGRADFDEPLRPMQTALAIGLCGLALFLALPILDFGAISARSQVARLEAGKVEPAEFDWAAMAFDFGPAGRERLRELARGGPAQWRSLAAEALKAKDRWPLAERMQAATEAEELSGRIRALSGNMQITPEILRRIAARRMCPDDAQCGLLRIDADRLILLVTHGEERRLSSQLIDLRERADVEVARGAPAGPSGVDLGRARIELRAVTRRQLFVDGKPVGEPIE